MSASSIFEKGSCRNTLSGIYVEDNSTISQSFQNSPIVLLHSRTIIGLGIGRRDLFSDAHTSFVSRLVSGILSGRGKE